MGSSTNKGNISGLLFTLTWICLLIIVIIVARLMITNNSMAGKYDNPVVATTVIGGTIYDRNKRVLAMDVPQYEVYVDPTYSDLDLMSEVLSLHLNMSPDEITKKISSSSDSLVLIKQNITEETLEGLKDDISQNTLDSFVYIKKSYKRTYPAQFHASQLINNVEILYAQQLFPQAEYNTNTTYGKDFVLTIDLDVQYILDLAVQNVYELQSADYVIAQIVDLSNNEVLASSYYPFFDLNSTNNTSFKTTLVGSFYYEGTYIEQTKIIKSVLNHNTNENVAIEFDESSLYQSQEEQAKDGKLSVTIAVIGNETQKYLVYLGSYAPKYYGNSTVLDSAVQAIKDGLSSQNKL